MKAGNHESRGAQAYLMFGDEESLGMYAEAHAAANATMRLVGGLAARGWLVDVHMASGQLSRVWVSSLAAFWPGLQALIGAPPPLPSPPYPRSRGHLYPKP